MAWYVWSVICAETDACWEGDIARSCASDDG